MEAAIYAKLAATSAVTNLVSTRIYPMRLPQSGSLPAIVYQRISTNEIVTHDGASNLAEARLQVTAWATTYISAIAIATAIRNTLQGAAFTAASITIQGCFLDDSRHNYIAPDDGGDTGAYSVSLDFMIWHEI